MIRSGWATLGLLCVTLSGVSSAVPAASDPARIVRAAGYGTESAWSILRQLESVPEAGFPARCAEELETDHGRTARALVLMAGAASNPGWTVGVKERRESLRNLARAQVRLGLENDGARWRELLGSGLGGQESGGLEFTLACIRLVAELDLWDFAPQVAQYLYLDRTTQPELGNPNPVERLLHREAQQTLFQLCGVRFATREEFQALPELKSGQRAFYRESLLRAWDRERTLRLELLRKDAQSGLALLRAQDPGLRVAAIERLVGAIGEQTLPLAQVRGELLARLARETNPEVFPRLLQAVSELALAAGPDSDSVGELREALLRLVPDLPTPLAPSLISAFERLPRGGADRGLSDWRAASDLLLALFEPQLWLDGDTTAGVLRSWSQINADLEGVLPDEGRKERCEQRMLDLLVDPGEPERVRLAAAETLGGARLGVAGVKRIIDELGRRDASNHLRLVCYPLVTGALERLPWDQLPTGELLDALLADIGSQDVDLSHLAISVARRPLILDRLVVLERERGQVLPVCMRALGEAPSNAIRRELLPLIEELSLSAPRPDLLAMHLAWPALGDWIREEPTAVKALVPVYLAMAGPGQGELLYTAAQTWLRAAPDDAQVASQALELMVGLDASEAADLAAARHIDLCRQADALLVRLPRSESAAWAERLAERLLEVHLRLARADGLVGEQFDHLEALLLASRASEDTAETLAAFDRALQAHAEGTRRRLWVLRDKARFLDATGAQAPAAQTWMLVVRWLQGAPAETRGEVLGDLDFGDLLRTARVAGEMGDAPLATALWHARTSASLWRGLPKETLWRDLRDWSEVVINSGDAELARRWLDFAGANVIGAGPGGGPEGSWLEWDEDQGARFATRLAEVLAVTKGQLGQKQEGDAEPKDGETPAVPPDPQADGEKKR
ncbi:MAG: hypothetical protein R3F17_00085 [Planctomycetota bacterium]